MADKFTGININPYYVYRYKHGVTLNPREYVLENGSLREFSSIDEILDLFGLSYYEMEENGYYIITKEEMKEEEE